jgi:hypothetical protein
MRRLAVVLLVVASLTACSGGTEQYRLDQERKALASVQPTTPAGVLDCARTPVALVRDWNRVLASRGSGYQAQRVAQLVEDIARGRAAKGCPGASELAALARAAQTLGAAGTAGPAGAYAPVAATGNKWLAAAHRSDVRFAGP